MQPGRMEWRGRQTGKLLSTNPAPAEKPTSRPRGTFCGASADTSPIRPHAPRAREPSDVFMDEQGATGAEDGSGGKSAARSGSDFNV
jgi:hypothetical protein